jgi:hypothetical protein
MPKGFHFGRTQKRLYTVGRQRIYAKTFKALLDSPIGNYELSGANFSEGHSNFKLIQSEAWQRVMIFTIQGKEIPVPLQVDSRSASNKVYLICPCCVKQRQHLYVLNNLYACRECTNLSYASQSEGKQERLARRIRKLRTNLWGSSAEINSLVESTMHFEKPKYMKWKSFEVKRDNILSIERQYWSLCENKLERMWGIGINC